MTEVKICGICRPADAALASAAGAAWIGVILAPGRTRSRTEADASAIFDAGPVRRVGVFVDADAAHVIGVARRLALDAVQLHGAETPATVGRIRDALAGQVWKALRIRSADDYESGVARYAAHVDAILLDGWSERGAGGVGASFDWASVAALADVRDVRRIVAGGLGADNVARAIGLLRPAVVDVSSGVEARPARKSDALIREFIAAVRGAGVDT